MAGVQADIAAGRLPSQMELAHDGAGRLGRAMEGINMGPTGPGGLSRWTMSPGSSLGAMAVFGDTRGRVENWETLTDSEATGGDRAAAASWELLAVLPGAVVAGAGARALRGIGSLAHVQWDPEEHYEGRMRLQSFASSTQGGYLVWLYSRELSGIPNEVVVMGIGPDNVVRQVRRLEFPHAFDTFKMLPTVDGSVFFADDDGTHRYPPSGPVEHLSPIQAAWLHPGPASRP